MYRRIYDFNFHKAWNKYKAINQTFFMCLFASPIFGHFDITE